MKKQLIASLLVGILAVSATAVSTSAVEEKAGQQVVAEQTQPGDEEKEEAKDTPVIQVSSEKFLVEQGSKFVLKDVLNLKITDATDGDMTDKVKIPDIDTSDTGLFNFKIEATNTKGKKAELTIAINVVGFVQSKTFETFDEVSKVDPSTVVTGNLKGLDVKLGEVSKENSTFDVTVTDGVNTLTKTIKAVDKEGNSFAVEAPATEEESKPQEETLEQSGNLPKTGTVAMGSILLSTLATVGGAGYFALKRKSK